MKLQLLVLTVVVAAAACNQQKRNDWRSPSPPMVCTTDAECRGGTCAIEPPATKGTCSLAPLPGGPGAAGDGGVPAPNVQPSPSDIHL